MRGCSVLPLETQLHTSTLVSRRPTCRLISSSTTCYAGLSGAWKGKHKPGTMLKAWSSTLTSMATVLSAVMSTYSCAFFGLRRTRLCRRTSTLKGFSCICRRQYLCTKRLQRTKPCLGLISNWMMVRMETHTLWQLALNSYLLQALQFLA